MNPEPLIMLGILTLFVLICAVFELFLGDM